MSLITAYRPTKWDDVIGQTNAVKTLSAAIEKKRAQVFALCGPSGTGKTTLARIAAAVIGCKANDLIEVDAATSVLRTRRLWVGGHDDHVLTRILIPA